LVILEVSSLELLEFDGGEESFEVSCAETVVIRSLKKKMFSDNHNLYFF
jgi:hypothetical protein